MCNFLLLVQTMHISYTKIANNNIIKNDVLKGNKFVLIIETAIKHLLLVKCSLPLLIYFTCISNNKTASNNRYKNQEQQYNQKCVA